MSDLKNKRIITVATTGAWPTKENNPNVPMTPAEIAEDAILQLTLDEDGAIASVRVLDAEA